MISDTALGRTLAFQMHSAVALLGQRDAEVRMLQDELASQQGTWKMRVKKLQERVTAMAVLEEAVADLTVEVGSRCVPLHVPVLVSVRVCVRVRVHA